MKLATALRALLVAAALWASLAVPTPAPAQFQNACTSLPCPSVDVNFTDNWYWVQGTGYVSYATLFSHVRASAESCVSPAGVVTYVTANNPCLTNGLAIWQAATNLALQSNLMTNAAWNATTATVTALGPICPDGTSTAFQVAATGSNARLTNSTSTIGVGNPYVVSLWVQTWAADVLVRAFDGGTGLHTDTAVSPGAGFARYSTTRTASIGSSSENLDFLIGTNGETANICFGQIEAGTTATPYIPTTITTAARAADVVKAAGAFLTTMQGAQGSVDVVQGPTPSGVYSLSAGLGNNFPLFYNTNTQVGTGNNAAQFLLANFGSGGYATGSNIAVAWSAAGRSVAGNAGTVATDTNAFATIGANLFFGSNGGGGQFLNGNTSKLTAWGYRVTDAQLNVISSGIPSNWVLSGASFDSDFTRGLYWSAAVGYVPYSTFYTHTRASSETCTNSLGVITYVTNGLPCQTNLGLAVWETRTNLCLHSQDTTGWGVGLGALTGNVSAAPDGATTASLYTENTSSGQHTFFSAGSTTVADSIYTISVYVKYSGRRYVVLSNGSTGVDWYAATFDLLTGTITQANGAGAGTGGASTVTASSITPTINGYRLSVTGSIHLTTTYIQVFPSTVPTFSYGATGSPAIYTGDGSSGVYWWGGQIELGSFPSPYIPTTTGTATRAGDVIAIAGSLATTIQGAAASILAKAGPTLSQVTPRIVGANVVTPLFFGSSGLANPGMYNGANLLQTANTSAIAARMGAAYDASGRSVSLNGGTVATDALAVGTLTPTLHLGDDNGNSQFLDGNIQRLSAFGSRLSNAGLTAFTAGNW